MHRTLGLFAILFLSSSASIPSFFDIFLSKTDATEDWHRAMALTAQGKFAGGDDGIPWVSMCSSALQLAPWRSQRGPRGVRYGLPRGLGVGACAADRRVWTAPDLSRIQKGSLGLRHVDAVFFDSLVEGALGDSQPRCCLRSARSTCGRC